LVKNFEYESPTTEKPWAPLTNGAVYMCSKNCWSGWSEFQNEQDPWYETKRAEFASDLSTNEDCDAAIKNKNENADVKVSDSVSKCLA